MFFPNLHFVLFVVYWCLYYVWESQYKIKLSSRSHKSYTYYMYLARATLKFSDVHTILINFMLFVKCDQFKTEYRNFYTSFEFIEMQTWRYIWTSLHNCEWQKFHIYNWFENINTKNHQFLSQVTCYAVTPPIHVPISARRKNISTVPFKMVDKLKAIRNWHSFTKKKIISKKLLKCSSKVYSINLDWTHLPSIEINLFFHFYFLLCLIFYGNHQIGLYRKMWTF